MTLQLSVTERWDDCVELRERWNDLWERSTNVHPTSRFEIVDEWIREFAPGARVRTLVVEQGRDLVAVLPLVGNRLRRVLPVSGLPRNDWLCPGTFLIDPNADVISAARMVARELNRQRWPLHRWNLLPGNDPAWGYLRNAIQKSARPFEQRQIYDVAWVTIEGAWSEYWSDLSKNHRKALSRTARRLDEQGGFQLVSFTPTSSAEAEPLLQECFAIEQGSWKGGGGTPIATIPVIANFVIRIAGHLILRRELEVAFLELDGKRIAFEILWNAKRVMASYKVGFLSGYEALMPGQMLVQELLRDLFETGRCEAYDCLGPNTTASSRWATHLYPVENWTIAGRGLVGRVLGGSYQAWSASKQRAEPAPFELRPSPRLAHEPCAAELAGQSN